MNKLVKVFVCSILSLALVACSAVEPPEVDNSNSITFDEGIVYDEPKTYNEGTVTADGAVIENAKFDGNLVIDEAVLDGDVTLRNVTVKGDLIVKGGGQNSIHIESSQIGNIVSNKEGSPVRIKADEFSSVKNITMENPTVLEISGKVDTLTVNAKAAGSNVTLDEKSTVKDVTINGKVELKTETPINDLVINAPSTLTINSTVASLQLKEEASDTKVTLGEKSVVSNVVTTVPVEISGTGKVENVVTDKEENMTGEVKGENVEVKENPFNEVKPSVEPTTTPEPTVKPTVRPTVKPTVTPSPSVVPTYEPTPKPTPVPTPEKPTTDKWDGTSDVSWYKEGVSVFALRNAEQLAGLAKLVNEGNSFENKMIHLKGYIDLNDIEWIPIGLSEESPFKGIFNGNGLSIINLNISQVNDGYNGLFGVIEGVTSAVKDLEVQGNIVSSKGSSGLVSGKATNGSTLDNLITKGSGIDKSVGGIVGHAYNNVKITNSINYANITSNGKSTSTAADNKEKNFAGGIVGDYISSIDSTIFNCQNEGDITAVLAGGGIAGQISHKDDSSVKNTIDACINKGNVSGGVFVGGIVGESRNYESSFAILSNNKIVNSANYGNISSTGTTQTVHVGGFSGIFSGTILNSNNHGSVVADGESNDGIGGALINHGVAGGFVADNAWNYSEYGLVIDGCINYGTISGNLDGATGFIGVRQEGSYVGRNGSTRLILENFEENTNLRLIGLIGNDGNSSVYIKGNGQELKNPIIASIKNLKIDNCTVNKLINNYGRYNVSNYEIKLSGNNTLIKEYVYETNSSNKHIIKIIEGSDNFIIETLVNACFLEKATTSVMINEEEILFDSGSQFADRYIYYSNTELNWNELENISVNLSPAKNNSDIEMITYNVPFSNYAFDENNKTIINKDSLLGQEKLILTVKASNSTTCEYHIKLSKHGDFPVVNLGIEGNFLNEKNGSNIEIANIDGIYKINVDGDKLETLSDIYLDKVYYDSLGNPVDESLNRYHGGYSCIIYFKLDTIAKTLTITDKSKDDKYTNVQIGDVYTLQENQDMPISLNVSNYAMSKGDTFNLVARQSEFIVRNAVWTSSNPEVASVSGVGLVTALQTGNTTITVQKNGKETTMDLIVVPDDNAVVALFTDETLSKLY